MRVPIANRFVLQIELGNDAMNTPQQIAKILKDLGSRIPEETINDFRGVFSQSEHIMDANGNTVGRWAFKKVAPRKRSKK
jgi:hypothetical protein